MPDLATISPDFDMPSNSARMVLVAVEHDEVRVGQSQKWLA